MMLCFLRILSTSCVVALAACSQVPLQRTTGLDEQLKETSALACINDRLWTINDSGNSAEIFQIDNQGQITKRIDLKVPNRDWEALSAVGATLFIADIGDNAGSRHELVLYRAVLKDDELSALSAFSLHYPDKPASPLVAYAHDFDAEALVALSESQLLLFSKSWASGISHVYQIDITSSTNATMHKIADVTGLPGVITDATRVAGTNDITVVGYINFRTQLLQFMFDRSLHPFIATLDAKFNVKQVSALPTTGQVEAVSQCQGALWISNEQSDAAAAQLQRLPH